jgi:hypothetical protein|tara:strand:- start:270 stop:500 length:231 start_codon:yes stop_codon:yes gene_type:complete
MSKAQRVSEQKDSVQEPDNPKVRVSKGGLIEGLERGLRLDMFDHDDPEVDEIPCICDLPEHAQDIIMEEFMVEDDA